MFEKVLEEVTSPVSGKIQVASFFGNRRIMVDGLVQSGGLLKGVWQKALSTINHQPLIISHQPLIINNCLILGLGGGTLATLVSQQWPGVEITGVEIDKEMIRLGKKYFDLDKIPNLKIVNVDAFKFVTSCPASQLPSYQLIFLDLYLGRKVPPKSEKEEFLNCLKKIVSEDGLIIFNRLFSKEEKDSVKKFIKKLEKIFPKISLVRTHSNLLIFLRKR